ncbi:efflux RND transporter permease subunit [Emcibacter sp.]|uniref:efflux RND transporter permease subunit n=1 Tax=Emcibacter sp. TaxID=1979954 RepID=UPI003A8FF192
MQITSLAINNSRVTIMGILLAVVLGISTFLTYPSAEDPSVTIRTAQISAFVPGMSAERIENLLTEPLEAALREIAEIKNIDSTSKPGETLISVEAHEWVSDLDPVFQDIRNKVQDTKRSLPGNTVGPFVYDDVGLTAIATVTLWTDGFSMAEMSDTAKSIRNTLYTLKGVRRVEIIGVQEEQILLEANPGTLAQLGISPEQIFSELALQNIIQPSGEIIADGRKVTLETTGNFESDEAIKNVVFSVPNSNQVVRLGEVVDIKRQYADPPAKPVYFNNQQAIILSVSTISGTNNIEFGKRLTDTLASIENNLPIGYVLEYATFQPDLIEETVQGAVSNVYQTLVIVLVVVMVFLGLRTGLIVGSFVPLTMLVGIIIMRLFDIELQRMSIAAMIIALGLLVDNGIVVAEDIRVRLHAGVGKITAAVEAGRTLAMPLLSSSLTTVFAFLPMMLLDGSTGDYVRSLAQVVAILLLTSWLLSLTVTPAMCVWFMKADPQADDTMPRRSDYSGRTYRLYRAILGKLLGSRFLFLGTLIILLLGSIQVLGIIRTEFFPLGARNQFLVYIDFEAGTAVREVDRAIQPLTRWLADTRENPEVTSHVAYIGDGGPRFFLALSPVDPDDHRAFILVNVKSPEQVSPLVERVNRFMAENIPGARADAKKMWFGSTEPGLLEIRLIGPESDKLASLALTLEEALHEIPDTVGIKHDWENKILKILIDVDQTRARRAGLSSSDIADALDATFSGVTISEYREGENIIPILFRAREDMRNSLMGLQQALIHSPVTASFVSLEQIATVRAEWQFGRTIRHNRERTLTLQARNTRISSQLLFEELAPVLNSLDLPPGYRWEIGGEVEDQQTANNDLFALLPLSLAGIALLLVGQFNSFRRGGIILLTIPLVLIGGVLGLVIMDAAFGFMVMLGFFSLAGILINNGIVLIDRIEVERKAGKEPLEAVITACLARLRPIMMTTLTTVLGLVPLILFGGVLFYGMASVIAWGLIVATIVTLGFVPVLYTLLFRIPVK